MNQARNSTLRQKSVFKWLSLRARVWLTIRVELPPARAGVLPDDRVAARCGSATGPSRNDPSEVNDRLVDFLRSLPE